MTFDLMKQLGLDGFDYSYIFIGLAAAIILLLIIMLVQMVQIHKLKNKYKKFMEGGDANSLEEKFVKLFEDTKEIKEVTNENKKDIRQLYKNMEFTFQKMGIVRYDAFQNMGGLLSFSLALLNERNDGFILNSVHSTDGCYSYTKEIKNGKCEIELSNEEKVALGQAMDIED